MYDTKEEVNQKLAGTVVLFNEDPVYIYEGSGKGSKIAIKYQRLESKEERSNLLLEPGWDFKDLGPRMGYCNIDMGKGSYKEACYLTRLPVRRVQACQGISQHNTALSSLKGSKRLGLNPIRLSFQQVYPTRPFVEMMKKKYPSYNEMSSLLKDPFMTSLAFHRQFAVAKHDVGPFYLEYRGKDIGYSDDLFRWKVAPEFKYLHETLEHINLRIAYAL